jgi:hypothetical protein
MALQRPLKEGSVRTYQEKVGLGFTDILASEADADFDTIYAAWNGGITTAELGDGAVTTPKLADLNVTTGKLANLAVTTGKLAIGAASPSSQAVVFPANWNSATYGSWVTVVALPALTTRGALVSIIGTPGAFILCNTNQTWIYFQLLRNATPILAWQYDVQGAAATRLPMPSFGCFDFPGAGSITYTFQVLQSSANGTLWVQASNCGLLQAVEFA